MTLKVADFNYKQGKRTTALTMCSDTDSHDELPKQCKNKLRAPYR
jgi:hypothetical protein